MLDIVFVDDEVDLCEVYTDLYGSETIKVKAFSKPVEAVEYVKANKVDACFIDYRMPEMNGIEFREMISQDIPCFMVTGELDIERPANFERLIRKPLRSAEFEEIIQNVSAIKKSA